MNDCRGNYDEIQAAYERIWELEQTPQYVDSSEAMEQLERSLQEAMAHLTALLLQKHLQASLDTSEAKAREAELIKSCPGNFKNEGLVDVWLYTMSGLLIRVQARYYRRSSDRRKGKRYRGIYAGLILLGIHERCTPLLGSTISMWSSLLSSFAEVQQVLLDQGMDLGLKVLRRLSYRYAERARIMQQAGAFTLSNGESVAGRRVVVSCDGGRIRLRENKTGPKTQKGRTRYKGAWREPKLLIIYVVDEKGKMEKSFAPIIDGNLDGPDGVFRLIQDYLMVLNIEQAEQVLFVADGAHWIWNRVPSLIKNLGLLTSQVHELLDFYHAVEHLGSVASLRKAWSAKERKAWVRKQRRLLSKGKTEQVIAAVQAICKGRNGKAITTERNYFIRNQHRMAYPTLKTLKLPLGSGAIESAIRRVVNLRLKGPCIFWRRENAAKMLMLRSYYKAGRWNILKKMANSHLSALPV
ncbi:MAG: hypothetical protein KAH77_06085 [Thiomargarita sp.]|nr:hypothetical protein [Thiomargarita sp.]